MGLFGVRRAASKDHAASESILSPSKKSAAVLANLFADDDTPEDPSPIPTDQLNPTVPAANKNGPPRPLSVPDQTSPIPNDERPPSAQSHARKARESMSRLVRRDSIKRSLSRKMARSENRRQVLNLKDDRAANVLQPVNSMSPHAVSHTATTTHPVKSSTSTSTSNSTLAANPSAPLPPPAPNAVNALENKIAGLTMSPVTPALARDDDVGDALLPAGLNDALSPNTETLSSSTLSLEAATFAFPTPTKQSQPQSNFRDGASSSSSKARSRRRPPPLGTQGKATDSGADWPSAGVFASDGGFMTGGFRITSEGVLNKPDLETRQDSDPEADEEAPRSEAMVLVRSLKEFRNGPTIGAGAAGRVYLAEHTPSKTTMAMKVVNVYNKEKRNQLLKELETLCTHVSRYLVRFHGAFYDGSGAVHIALEYMDHGCLATFVQRVGPIPERVVQMIAQDCLRGLRFLHHHHVLHRDFKTANILLSRKLCRAKLSDFGLARDLNPGVSKVDTFVGTVAYMSPERLQGGKYTYASDVWALGVSLVECLIGRHPFNKPQNYFDYIEATAASGTLEGFDDKESRFSAEAHDFITQCLYTDPKKRPNAANLLEHRWIKGVRRNNAEFGSWLDEARSISMRVSSQKQ